MKFIRNLIIAAVCICTPLLLYIATPDVEQEVIDLSNTKVALVNQDEGIYKGEDYQNYSSNLINKFLKESQFNAITTNYADASTMLDDGDLMYVIVFEKDFSRNIDNFDSKQPSQGTVTYYYNHTYNAANGNVIAENERDKVFADLQNELSTVYTKTIISELQSSKDMLTEDIETDIELTEDIKATTDGNTASLNEQISSSNELISSFKNDMGKNIDVVNDSIVDTDTEVKDLIKDAQTNRKNLEKAIADENSNNETQQQNLESSKGKFTETSDLLVDEEGVLTQLLDYYVPSLKLYDKRNEDNLNSLLSIKDLDTITSGSVCSMVSEDNSESLEVLESHLLSIQYQQYNSDSGALEARNLYTAEQVDALILQAQEACVSVYADGLDTTSLQNTANLDILKNNLTSSYLNNVNSQITKDYTIIKNIQINKVYADDQASVPPIAGNPKQITAADIELWNNYLKLFSVIDGSPEPLYYQMPEEQEGKYMYAYISGDLHTEISELIAAADSQYSSLGGTLDLSVLAQMPYHINGLPADAGSPLHALNSEYNDISTDLDYVGSYVSNLEVKYADSIFYNTLKQHVLSDYISVFPTGNDDKSVMDLAVKLEGFAKLSKDDTQALIVEYEKQYQTNLTMINDNSQLIVNTLKTSDADTLSIIEKGNMVINNNQNSREQNSQVKESNNKINELYGSFVESNNKTSKQVKSNQDAYIDSVLKLEEANDEQQVFIEEYATVLDVANVEGINNNSFYSFITNPIRFERTEVNLENDEDSSYFILLWLFVGLILLNIIKDSKSKYLDLNIRTDSFVESSIVKFTNRYLLTILAVLIYGGLFGLIISYQFMLSGKLLFILRFTIITALLFITMRLVISGSKRIGYTIICGYLAVMYIALYTSSLPTAIKVIMMPITSLNNFVLADVYKYPYANPFVYCLAVYGVLSIVAAVIYYIKTKVLKRS